MFPLRFMTWNLRGAWRAAGEARLDAQAATLDEAKPAILAAQEVTPSAFARLSNLPVFQDAAFALHEDSATNRCEYGSALFFSRGVDVASYRRLTSHELGDVREEVRELTRDLTIVAEVSVDGLQLTVGSFHIPAAQGTRWRWQGKRGVIRGVAAHLAKAGDGIAGIDANGPKLDHPDVRRNVYWYDGTSEDREDYLLHDPARALHDYRDSLRVFLEANPLELERILAENPEGPLAVSHRRNGVPCRYDFVFAQGLVPHSAPLHLDVGKASDHSAVLVELGFR